MTALRATGLAIAGVLLSAAVARAAPVTLGQLDPTPHDQRSTCGYAPTIYVEGSSNGESGSPAYPPPASSPYLVPAGGGTITSWTVSQAATGEEFRLAVVSFGPDASSLVVDAFSPVETIPASADGAAVTFPAAIPVQAGQEIALDTYGGPMGDGCAFPSSYGNQVDIADDGQEGTHNFGSNAYIPDSLLSLEATLQPSGSTGGSPTSTRPTGPSSKHKKRRRRHHRKHRRHRHHRSARRRTRR